MISTDRLSLRQIHSEDEKFIVGYLAHEDHARYLPLGRPYTREEALAWFNARSSHWRDYHFGTFIIVLRQTHEVIGYCGLEYVRETKYIDIRYGITRQFWGGNYAYEAALAVLECGFSTLGVEKLYGAAVPQNVPSLGLLKKLGMTKDDEFCSYGDGVVGYSVTSQKHKQIFSGSKRSTRPPEAAHHVNVSNRRKN